MNSSTIFTRRSMGLDRRVWWVLALVCVGSIGLLGYGLISNEPCHPIQLAVKNGAGKQPAYYPNETLQFTALMSGSKDISWDFGDNTTAEIKGPAVTHVYANPGDYVVTARINGRCNEALAVRVIRSRPVQEKPTENPVFVGDAIIPSNRFPQVGERVSFTSNIDAKTYEWTIAGNAASVKSEKMATYIFDLPQLYTVNLKLDNDAKKVYSIPVMVAPVPKANEPKPITTIPRILIPPSNPPTNNPQPANTNPAIVNPQPVAPTPTAPTVNTEQNMPPRKFLYKNTEQFKAMLEEVISGDRNVKDFEPYLCDGANTLVIENGNQTTFAGLCRILAGEKKKIISVEFLDYNTYADKSRCVKELKVKHEKKKKGIFK